MLSASEKVTGTSEFKIFLRYLKAVVSLAQNFKSFHAFLIHVVCNEDTT